MKIVDNSNNEKRGKKPFIIGCSACLCVILIVVLVIVFSKISHKNQTTNGDNHVVDVFDVETQTTEESVTLQTPEPTQQTPMPTEEPKVDSNLEQVVSYTSTRTDEEGLIQLVKDTIAFANADLQEASKENESLPLVLDVLESVGAEQYDQLDVNFVEAIPEGVDLKVDESLTALDVAGSIGNSLFEQYESFGPEGYTGGKNLLAHFVGYGLYGVNVNGVSDWSVQADNLHKFVDGDVEFEVNFDVLFTSNGIKWMALVGNVDGEYRVLDVINANKDQSLLKLIEDPVELTVPQSEPEPQPQQPGGNGGNGNGGGDGGNDGGNTDPNAGQPSYEGEKDGYIWTPGIGYVPTTPTPNSPDLEPDHRNEYAPDPDSDLGPIIGNM